MRISMSPWSCSPTSAYIDECDSSATPAAGEYRFQPVGFWHPKNDAESVSKTAAIDVCDFGATLHPFFRYTNYQVSLLILSVQKQMENPSETLANYRSKCSIFMLRGEAKQIGVNPNHRANALRRVPCAEIGYTLYSIITPKKSKKICPEGQYGTIY